MSDATFAEAVDCFRRTHLLSLKPSTQALYTRLLDTELVPRFGTKKLSELSLRAYAEFDAELARRGLTTEYRTRFTIVFRSVMRIARVSELIAELPAMPTVEQSRRRVIRVPSDDEVARVLEVSDGASRMAFALAGFAGLRMGEVRALRWSDVELQRGCLVVRRSRFRSIEAPPKSGHERAIPLAPFLADLLAMERASPSSPSALVTSESSGRPWGAQALRIALHRAQERAGAGRWTFHALRHYFVTTLFRVGTPAHVVQRLAGHLHLIVTQRYAHAERADLRAAIERL